MGDNDRWFSEKRIKLHRDEKESIARQVLERNLIAKGDNVFFSTGSTCFLLAIEAAKKLESLSIWTNSIFVASEIADHGYEILPRASTINILRGPVDRETGLIGADSLKESDLPKDASRKLFFTTRGFDEKGLSCRYNESSLKAVIGRHKDIYVLLTYDKIRRERYKVKDMGNLVRENNAGTRKYTFVFPEFFSKEVKEEERKRAKNLIKSLKDKGFSVYPDKVNGA